ncbi:MAG: bifunctional adenosylcobinamide kinase/adenosylcobinamide-phosphate guanylyltransferase [Nitratireductor sp.]
MVRQVLERGVTFVLGGARSGKSAHAEKLVLASGLTPVYLATGQAWDGEMENRITAHKARRGSSWKTVEAPLQLAQAIEGEAAVGNAVLVDCLTLWITNLMMAEADIAGEVKTLANMLATVKVPVVVVSNETGLGIVPDNAMARAFRDHAGLANQKMAAVAHTVWFVAAGLPLLLKNEHEDRERR